MALPRTSIWLTAGLLTLLTHALVGVAGWAWSGRTEAAPAEPSPLRLVFERPPESLPVVDTDPSDPAETPPPDPVARAESNQLAQAPEPGTDRTPAAELESPIPALDAAPTPQPTAEDTEPTPRPGSGESSVSEAATSAPPARLVREFHRVASGSISGPTGLEGAIQLSTTAWPYAPWLREFERNLRRVWRAPSGYRYGLISGSTLLELTINPDGSYAVAPVLVERVGHQALHDASLRAVNALELPPLPASFPEETLGLRLSLTYPDWSR